MGLVLSSKVTTKSPVDISQFLPTVKKSRNCLTPWSTCSRDTTVDNIMNVVSNVGCWDHRWNSRKTRLPQNRESYESINGIDYQTIKTLGEGRHSKVLQAFQVDGATKNKQYAIKIYQASTHEGLEKIKHYTGLMLSIGTSCDTIVSLHQYQIITEESTGCSVLKCVLDLCLGSTLAHRLASQPIVTEHFARSITTQILKALHFLHMRHIVHTNVKPENILFCDTTSLSIKLSDLEMATICYEPVVSSNDWDAFSNSVYVAPEVLTHQVYSTSADMWSLGILVYQLLTGKLPFQSGTHGTRDVMNEITSGCFLPYAISSSNFPDNLSFDALRFVERLLRMDANQRFNVIEALNHRWISMPSSNGIPHRLSSHPVESKGFEIQNTSLQTRSHSQLDSYPFHSTCVQSNQSKPSFIIETKPSFIIETKPSETCTNFSNYSDSPSFPRNKSISFPHNRPCATLLPYY